MRKLTVDEIKFYQLNILDTVNEFCRKNGINYYLFSGTLIGAIRHNGYIPWDDDIDIMMFRKDYELFIEKFNEEYQEYHAFSIKTDKGYNHHFCKIAYNKTKLQETNLQVNDVNIGVNIDLFPIDFIPQNKNIDYLLKKLHQLDALMYYKSFRWNRLKFKPYRQRVLIILGKLAGLFTSIRFLGEEQERLAQLFNEEATEKCAVITCHAKHHIPIWYIEDFTPIDWEFEGRKYLIPKGYDRILKEQWGEYMKLPPENDRISHHAFDVWKENNNG